MTGLRQAGADTFRSFRVRNFRLFFTGQSISQIGNWLTRIAQTLLVLRLTGSGVAVGLLAAAHFGPLLVFGAFAGLVADRSDKRKLLFIIQALAMVQSLVLAALAFMDQPPLAAIYAVAIVGGFAVAFDNPARRSFVVEMVPDDHIGNAVSLNSALMTGARVIGPALAGLLVTTVGFGWTFLVDAVSYVAVLVCLGKMDSSQLRPAPETTRGRGQVRAGLRYARGVPELWIPLIIMAVIGTLAFNFQTVLPLFAIRDLGGGTGTFTILMSVLSLGSLLGALATARRVSVELRSVSLSALAFGASLALLTVAPNTAAAMAVGLLVGVSSISFMTASTAIVQMRADPAMRGRVLALQAIVFLGSTPIGGPLVGVIAEAYGARYSLALGAVATMAAGLYGLSWQRRHAQPVATFAPPEEPSLLDPAITPRAS